MRIAFCTNIAPVADPSGLRGRNHAIIARLSEAGHDVELLHGPEGLLRGDDPARFDVGMLCPNDLVEPVPDPSGRLRADTVALALEHAGLPFLNSPLRRRLSTNKLLTHVALARAGVAQPRAWTLQELGDVAWSPQGVVVKPVGGSGGLGVALAHTPEEVLAHVAATGEECFLEEFIAGARCIRVIATADASVGRWETRVAPGTVVVGMASGGTEVALDPRDDLDDLAIAVTRAVAMDITGVDVLEAPDGRLLVLEANANFGFFARNGEILDALVEQVRVAGTTRRAPEQSIQAVSALRA